MSETPKKLRVDTGVALIDAWTRLPFYGETQTDGAGFYWWIDADGIKHALMPVRPVLYRGARADTSSAILPQNC